MIPAGLALECPTCHGAALGRSGEGYRCPQCDTAYPATRGRPILFSTANTMFRAEDYVSATPADLRPRSGLRRFIPEPSVNLSVHRVLGQLGKALPPAARILVVGAGGQRGWLDPMLGGLERTIVYTDVDGRADVDVFCDGHDLPFPEGSFDAVVTTAVLEHVADPVRVAGEITRVTAMGGWLYSELPFMQQVHEGAYDFTRFTLSGHRRLFRHHREIEAGLVAGPGTALAWSLENFFLAFARGARARVAIKAGTRLAFAWLKYLDRLIEHRAEAMDGASCTYLLARRADEPRSDQSLIAGYVGAKPYAHL